MAMDEAAGWVPDSCSLPTVEQPLRVAEFDQLFGESAIRSVRVSPTRLEVVLAPEAEIAARDLAGREVACCSFFGFEFASTGPEVVMTVEVPESRIAVLDVLTERVRALVSAPSNLGVSRVRGVARDVGGTRAGR